MTTMDDLDVDFGECPICLDIFKDASNLRRCGHDFCNSCISRWLSTNNTCPVCRDRADPGDVLPSRLLRIFFSYVNLHAAATGESDAAKRLRIKETHEFLVQFMGALSVEERRIMGINRRQTGHPLVMMQPITPHVDMMHGSAVNSRAQIPPTHSHMQQEQEEQYHLNMGPSLVTQPYNDSTNAMVYYGVSTDDTAQFPHNHYNMQHQQPQYHPNTGGSQQTNFEHSYHPSHQFPQITHTPPPRVTIPSSSRGPGNTASYPFGREYHRDYQQQQRRLNMGPLPPPQMQHHRHNNSPHHQLQQASPLSPSYPPLPPRDNPSITNSLRGEYNDYGGRRSSRNPTGREHRHQDHNRSRSRSRSG